MIPKFLSIKHPVQVLLSCTACLLSLSMCACDKADTEAIDNTGNTSEHSMDFKFSQEDIWFERDGLRIYGRIFMPEGLESAAPLVIISHGFGGSHSNGNAYARALAGKGYAALTFDFCGGSNGSRSDGKTTQMSIRTEEADLIALISAMKADKRIDAGRIYLAGASQGGMVSAMTAADRPEDVRAIVLIYPALIIPDDVHEWFPAKEDITETFSLWGTRLGSIYATDAYDYDVYAELPKFKGDVLIIHGTSDSIVPIAYSERAVDTYGSADLKVLQGAGHGFYGKQQDQSIEWMLSFLNKQENKLK